MKFLLLFLAGISIAAAVSVESLKSYTFEEYLTEFGKSYKGEELVVRRRLFDANMKIILKHNSLNGSFFMNANQFTDMTHDETRAFRGYKPSILGDRMTARVLDYTPLENLPTEIDWRTVTPPVVTPVKDQRACGSCWAFSATESIESHLAIATKNLTILSPQNLVSCTPNPNHCGGTGGCDGATAELAFEYVKAKGIATEATWPYRGTNGVCDETHKKVAKVSGFIKVEENSYQGLMNAIQLGPVSISVDASSWSSYGGGIFDGCSHTKLDIDHAVQLVGYGTSAGKDFWIVRNSWGPSWGERGYMRLLRHSSPDPKWCAIDNTPDHGSGCTGGPGSVTVCGTCGILYDNCYPLGASLV